MAGRRPSSRGSATSRTAGSSNIIDLTDDSPPRLPQSGGNDQYASPAPVNGPRGTPNLRRTPRMDPQYAQDGSFMPNVNMQMQQRMRNMNPQEQLAYIQQYRQHHAQTQEACAGNGQQLVGGPNHTQGINMGMATDQGPTIEQQSMNMQNLPQQFGSQFGGGSMSSTQSPFSPNRMAQFGQHMPAATSRASMPPIPAQQQQHGQHQVQRQPSAVDGFSHYTPEQLRQIREQRGEGPMFAQSRQHLSTNEVAFNNMPRNAHHTAGSVSLSSPDLPQPGQKRPLNDANGPSAKRHASQSASMNGTQRANLSTQNQQLGQNISISRPHSMSAAMAQQQNPLTPNATIGSREMAAMMNQMGGSLNLSQEQHQVFLAERQLMNNMRMMQNQQMMQTQSSIQNQQSMQNLQAMQNHQRMLNQQRTQSQQPMQNRQSIQNQQDLQTHQGVPRQQTIQNQQGIQYSQGLQIPQGTQNQQQGVQNQQRVQNLQPTPQQLQLQRQHVQIPHQPNIQIGANSQQHSSLNQHQQHVRNAHQSIAQNGDSRQPQTPSAQILQQTQAPVPGLHNAATMFARRAIQDLRRQRGQSTDLQNNHATKEEMAKIQPYLQKYTANYYAQVRQVVAPSHASFPQQDARQQQRPQQITPQQPIPKHQEQQQQVTDQHTRAQEYHQAQQRLVQERQQTLNRQEPVQQPQTRQQLGGQQQNQRVAAVSGTPRASASSSNPSVVDQKAHHRDLASSSPAATAADNSSTSPNREDHSSSSPSLQGLSDTSPPKDDIEVRLEQGLTTFLRESASPKQDPHHNYSSSQAAASQPSQESVSSTPAPAIPRTSQSGTGLSGAVMSRPKKKLKQLQGAVAAGPADASARQQASYAPIQQSAAASRSASNINSVTKGASGAFPESTSSTVPRVSSRGETSASSAGNSAVIEGAAGESYPDFLDSITNPGGDWQLQGNGEFCYGLFDSHPSPAILPDNKWVDAAAPSYPPIRLPGEEGVDRLLALSNISVPPVDRSDKQRQQDLRNLLHPEDMTASEGSNAVEIYGYPIGDLNWEALYRHHMPEDEARKMAAQRRQKLADEEAERPIEAEPVFASQTGPYTSVDDAFNHRMNQELGVGWEAHNDPSLFPDREAGSMDPATFQNIEDGTYMPSIFECGHVDDLAKWQWRD